MYYKNLIDAVTINNNLTIIYHKKNEQQLMKATEKAESQNGAKEDGESPNAKNKHSLKFATLTNRSGVFLRTNFQQLSYTRNRM